jgi:SH3-like domain-containing protein
MKANRVVWSALVATLASFSVGLPAFARPATLIAQDSGSRINVRSAPSTQSTAAHYGLIGDRIEVMSSMIGNDDSAWNYVKFASGAKGWVRGDFIRYSEGMAKYALLLGQRGQLPTANTARQHINVRSSPSIKAASPHYGLEGDIVQVLTQKTGSDGFVWRYVKFPSGVEGWVRGDLIQAMEEGGC